MQTNISDPKTLDAYYSQLLHLGTLGVAYEQGTRAAFRELLSVSARPVGWTLVEEYTLPGSRRRPDGTLLDKYSIPHGYWEAKDTKDDLEAEIAKKIAAKYDLSNTIFEDTRRAVLYQNGKRVFDIDLQKRDDLAHLLTRYFSHSPAEVEEYHKAADVFAEKIPVLAKALMTIVDKERTQNAKFKAAFADFHEMCRASLNPEIGAAQIEEMLVQHLLTERLFRTVFGQSEFASKNVIAAEIEKVIDALTSQSFNRTEFLNQLDWFYVAIENTARKISDFGEKQGFLNNVYERFFQRFSPDTADTHGIVYTPQPIVDFMCESVEEVLHTQFGKALSDKGVTVLDPCTGTGNFLVNILRRIGSQNRFDLRHKYEHELFANEVMLLPYYVASLNMERAYYDLQGHYAAFPGLCFADTLDLAKGQQMTMAFTEKNTERVKREQDAAITVIIGNPPYNVGQANENDNNKNRKYTEVDGRIRETYVKDSKATLHTKTYDAYVRFFRWATDRLNGQDGIVCFVTNNGYLHGVALDGLRKHLAADFTQLYILDLGGNARRGGGGSVFGIRVGVSIVVAVRKAGAEPFVKYCAVPNDLAGRDKLAFLKDKGNLHAVDWQTIAPDTRHSWLTDGMEADFYDFLPMGTKDVKASQSINAQAIFKTYSLGVSTNRDGVVYDFNRDTLATRVKQFIEDYNAEVHRWINSDKPKKHDLDAFLNYTKVKWSEHLKAELQREKYGEYDANCLREALYRPFCKQNLYYSGLVVDRPAAFDAFLPTPAQEAENMVICLTDLGSEKPFMALMANQIPNLHTVGFGAGTQCFPLYTYSLNGAIRRYNITDWALAQFQTQYGPNVTKPDIFYSLYALLHAPGYRTRYAENLKRDLPRLPLMGTADTFTALADAGRKLAALHIGYETADEYPLKQLVNKDVPFSWCVGKMKLSKDRAAVIVNDSLTLAGVPPEALEYKLGNRSALEWVIDQYQTTTDKRSGLTSDPNREGDPEYIARLVGRVVTVSVETMRIIAQMPPLKIVEPEGTAGV